MVRTQIQIHSEQLKWLKHRALGKGVSMSQLIRDSIDFYRTHAEKSSRLEEHQKKGPHRRRQLFHQHPNVPRLKNALLRRTGAQVSVLGLCKTTRN